MSSRISCPSCGQMVAALSNDSPPAHCPECGSRIACPQCGSVLEKHPTLTSAFRCTNCKMDLAGLETQAFLPTADDSVAHGSDVAVPLPGFDILEKIDGGGMGIVYAAYQRSLQCRVAVKVLYPALAFDRVMVERFINEARVVAGLRHPHIMPVHDILDMGGTPAIVMPLINGRDLGKIVRDRHAHKKDQPFKHSPHPWVSMPDRDYLDRVLPVLDQVIEAVTVVHEKKIVHRDIKPGNIMVDERGQALLADFGLARLQSQDATTRGGSGPGTHGYAAPEQVRGDADVKEPADVFSVGVTIYHALTLEMPYGREVAKPTSPPPRPPSKLQPLLSRDMDDVIRMATEPDLANRYDSSAKLQEDWKLVRQGLPPKYARHVGWLERSLRAIKRRPAETVAGIATTAFLVALALLLPARRLPGEPTPGPPEITQTIRIETEPPNARLAIVRLDPDSGYPLGDNVIRPPERSPTNVVNVPVGEYLVVAKLDNGDFHEVYRIVPEPGREPDALDEPLWVMENGVAKLKRIRIPVVADVVKDMAFRKGGTFTMGLPSEAASLPHYHPIAPFYMDIKEVTYGQYKSVFKSPAPEIQALKLSDGDAVRGVTWLGAMMCAEALGKRLPWEDEYEYCATNRGQYLFPWGNEWHLKTWSLGPAGEPKEDVTIDSPKIYGLYSNVGEWTMSYFHEYPLMDPEIHKEFSKPSWRAKLAGKRIVRGAPSVVLQGGPLSEQKVSQLKSSFDSRKRPGWDPYKRLPGLGFRGARSAEATWLNLEP